MAGARKESLKVELTATDKLSKVVDKAAKAVDDLDGEKAEVEVTADTDKAEQQIETVDKLVDELDGATAEATISAEDKAKADIDEVMRRLQDLEDEEVVAVLSAKATKLEAEIKNANALLSKLDGEDATAVITAKDHASAQLKEVNGRLNDLRGGFKHVTTEGTQSRSVLANLAGNSAQDLGELGGVVGSLGVGVGQLAEYAVDGNIKMKELGKVAGPMLGVAAATALISTALQGVKAEQAFRRGLVDEFTEALRAADSVIESIRDKVRETGELQFSDEGGLLGLGQETEDLIPVLHRLGLSFNDFMHLVELSAGEGQEQVDAFLGSLQQGSLGAFGNFNADADALADGIDQYGDSLRSAEEAQRIFDDVMVGTSSSIDDINNSLADFNSTAHDNAIHWDTILADLRDGQIDTDQARIAWDELKETLGKTDDEMSELAAQKLDEAIEAGTKAADDAADALGGLESATQDVATTIATDFASAVSDAVEAEQEHADAIRDEVLGALKDEQAQLEATIETLEGYIDAQRDAYDTSVDYREATEDAQDALADYQDALTEVDDETGELIASTEDIEDAGEDFIQSLLDQSDALVDQNAAQAAANNTIYSGTQAIEDQNAALLATASTIPDELLPQFAEMITAINGIPEAKETVLKMLREGVDPAAILEYLNGISGTHKAAVEVEADQAAINRIAIQLAALTQPRTVKIYTASYGGLTGKRAAGGPVEAGEPYTVGERGTELFVPGEDGTIIPAAQTAALLGATGHLTPASGYGGAASGGDVYHVNINMPPGSNGQDVLRALQQVQRQYGPLPLRTTG